MSLSVLPELEELRPAKVCFVEQVSGFLKATAGRPSPYGMLARQLQQVYGPDSVTAVKLNSGLWLEGSRERLPSICTSFRMHLTSFPGLRTNFKCDGNLFLEDIVRQLWFCEWLCSQVELCSHSINMSATVT
jgi:hypothetical protein